MSGTLAVVTVYQGREMVSSGFDQAEAAELAEAIAELDGWDSGPDIVNLLPDLEARFPAGTPVWLSQRVYWRKGQPGTVAEGVPLSFARWAPRPGPVPWFIGGDGPSVFVALDDGYASWWPAKWLELR